MENITKIDTELSTLMATLKAELDHYKFEPKFEFVLNKNFDLSFLEKIKYPGVYLIEIHTGNQEITFNDWVKSFLEKWQDKEYVSHFVPNSRKGRLAAHKDLSTWFPLYIGKSKDISKRIKEHLYLEMKRPTGALKLIGRENIYDHVFKVSTIRIEVKNYDIIMPQLERMLRNKINPILGRQ
jgi:hypothetical protein